MEENYYREQSAAWEAAHIDWPKREKWKKKDVDQLRAEYIAEYGYGVLIPDFKDIVHYKPNSMLTKEERIERKTRNLYRILASPSPNWVRSYASVMTWLDNIQDAMTTGLVMSMLLRKWAPRIFARAVPVLGWMLLVYDLLSLTVNLGRTPLTPMRSKRALCEYTRSNPFKKKGKRSRQWRLWNMKPSWGAAIEVAQTTDWLFGVGLALGSIFGAVTDAAFVFYRQMTGEPVHYYTDPPVHHIYEITGFKSLKAAAMISAAGQIFDDETHFWTYITYAGSVVLTAPIILADPPEEYIKDPMTVMIPADVPTNPETIEVIRAAGLSIENGVNWPANNEKEIRLDELADWQAVNALDSVTDYLFRHRYDWNGFLAAAFMHEAHSLLLDSTDEGAEVEEEYEPLMHVTLQMLKNGITPTDDTQTEEWSRFNQWCNDHRAMYEEWPGIREIKEKLDLFGVSYQTSFPTTQDPASLEVFPPESLNETLWEEDYMGLEW